MNLTKLNVAGMASSILFIAFVACVTTILILVGDPDALNRSGWVALVWHYATSAIACVLYKLGFQRSWYYTIVRWVGFCLMVIACVSIMVSYQQKSNYGIVALFGIYFFLVTFSTFRSFFAVAPTGANDNRIQDEASFMAGSGIWMTFISLGILLFYFTFFTIYMTAFATEGETPIVTLYTVTCIILFLLLVLTFRVAVAPSTAHGIAEPLAPEEETVTSRNNGDTA